ncbi:leucyl aminopeptidase [Actinomyces sp. 2119]|uniref:leucyl aminopeptidase n=1 Tax=Actinomyces sp. 2119 TaxID=2321393 RepID=UPI000E6BFAB7|nr:leucyl aminopeptidase [Actinomyces sp. 2119]RJF44688.1 leucyl aminopeptidase [Actinomyces sp. 2119]
MTTVSLSSFLPSGSAADAVDVLVLAAAPGREAAELVTGGTLPRMSDGTAVIDTDALEALLPTLGFSAEQDAVVRVPASAVRPTAHRGQETLLTQPTTPPQQTVPTAASTVLVVGLGRSWHLLSTEPDAPGPLPDDAPALGEDRLGLLRRAAGRATRALGGTSHVAMALPTQDLAQLRSVCEGALLGAYSWRARAKQPAQTVPGSAAATTQALKTPSPDSPEVSAAPVDKILLLSPLARDDTTQQAHQVVEEARVLAQATSLARDLVNEPANWLSPSALAQRAAQMGQDASLEVTVWDEEALAREGLGALLGVGQGSSRPPRLVRLRWDPPTARTHTALVGKGITFDSGGLSLKPPAAMPDMKSDMAGAAAVLATVLAASRLSLPVRVTAWLALAENMPGPEAQRPGDVVITADGTSVEVTNTDAEGRLVMADALALAVAEAPDRVIDVATLTGAQVVALGERVCAVMGTPAVRDEVVAAARRAGEAFWPMPLPAYLRSSLESPVADLRNAKVGSRAAGMLTAGLFLREFVGSTPWAHLDVAGPAFNGSAPWGLTPVGGTGVGVATLTELLCTQARNP